MNSYAVFQLGPDEEIHALRVQRDLNAKQVFATIAAIAGQDCNWFGVRAADEESAIELAVAEGYQYIPV